MVYQVTNFGADALSWWKHLHALIPSIPLQVFCLFVNAVIYFTTVYQG